MFMKTIKTRVQAEIGAERGVVFLDGPIGLSASMTPAAARRMGRQLLSAARAARGQLEHLVDTDDV